MTASIPTAISHLASHLGSVRIHRHLNIFFDDPITKKKKKSARFQFLRSEKHHQSPRPRTVIVSHGRLPPSPSRAPGETTAPPASSVFLSGTSERSSTFRGTRTRVRERKRYRVCSKWIFSWLIGMQIVFFIPDSLAKLAEIYSTTWLIDTASNIYCCKKCAVW